MDVKAKTSVVENLSDSILETILDKTKAKDIMSTVEKTFTTIGLATQIKIKRELRNLSYKGESNMSF